MILFRLVRPEIVKYHIPLDFFVVTKKCLPGTVWFWGQLFLIWMSLTVFEGAPLPSNRFDRDVMAPLSSTSAAWGFLVKNDNTLFLVEDILYIRTRLQGNWLVYWSIQYWGLWHIYMCYIHIWRINKLLIPNNLYSGANVW